MRSDLFSYMQSLQPQMRNSAQTTAGGLSSAAADPFWGQAKNYASNELGGNYLAGSPQLDRSIAANTSQQMASAADASSRLKSGFGKNGMGFSTGYTQADEANKAAAAANAGRTNAQESFANYSTERANQNNAPQLFQSAQSAPLNYLSQIPSTLLSSLGQEGNLLSSLSSGGQVITPNTSQNIDPSLGSNIMNGFSGIIGSL
jgi:hypothetical protein